MRCFCEGMVRINKRKRFRGYLIIIWNIFAEDFLIEGDEVRENGAIELVLGISRFVICEGRNSR